MRAFSSAIRDADTQASSGYVHNQGTPSATWIVSHNLNRYPAVDVVDTGGSVVIPSILYNDVNTVTVTFGSATSGKAFCN
jgi:hypothetical protein